VALLTPCLRQTSAVLAPLIAFGDQPYFRSIPMICSSVNLDALIVRLLPGDGLYSNLEEF